jgi:hypothetical protein
MGDESRGLAVYLPQRDGHENPCNPPQMVMNIPGLRGVPGYEIPFVVLALISYNLPNLHAASALLADLDREIIGVLLTVYSCPWHIDFGCGSW